MGDEKTTVSRGVFPYPFYDELPEELMFTRDMVAFVNGLHGELPKRVRRGKTFTAAMATNYVKGGLTPPAIGRRYDRDHLALILFAATAKLCFSAEEVYWLADELFDPADMRASHDAVARAFRDVTNGKTPNSRAEAVAQAFFARVQALA